jgi:hypothetical protein
MVEKPCALAEQVGLSVHTPLERLARNTRPAEVDLKHHQ